VSEANHTLGVTMFVAFASHSHMSSTTRIVA
jgi:hypothetical protein